MTKPRIRKSQIQPWLWLCYRSTSWVFGYGQTPEAAYQDWCWRNSHSRVVGSLRLQEKGGA